MAANDKSRRDDQQSHTGAAAIPPDCAAVLVYATFPSEPLAVNIGRQMVEARLAGCINVLPGMTSVYVWEGKTETSSEVVLIAKMPANAAERAVAFIKANHPYDTPAILVLPVAGGSAEYLAWLALGTAPA